MPFPNIITLEDFGSPSKKFSCARLFFYVRGMAFSPLAVMTEATPQGEGVSAVRSIILHSNKEFTDVVAVDLPSSERAAKFGLSGMIRRAVHKNASFLVSPPSITNNNVSDKTRPRRTVATIKSRGTGVAVDIRVTKTWSCLACGTQTTPQRRKSSMGINSLCNGCGLKWAKGGLRELDKEAIKRFGTVKFVRPYERRGKGAEIGNSTTDVEDNEAKKNTAYNDVDTDKEHGTITDPRDTRARMSLNSIIDT